LAAGFALIRHRNTLPKGGSAPHIRPGAQDVSQGRGRSMFRIVVAVVAVALIALPSILICLRWRVDLPLRLLLAVTAFVLPLVMIWGIHLVPSFNGQAPENPSFWRGIGILLSTATLIVPWLIYTVVRDRPLP
jgi:hypothetical protein